MSGLWLLFVLAIVVGAVLLALAIRRPQDEAERTGRVEPAEALEILAQRYARGEIDRDEFEDRRRTLSGY